MTPLVLPISLGTVLAASDSSGFQGPSIDEFFPDPFLLAGTPLAINRVIFVRLVITAALVIVLLVASRRPRLVPTRGQALMEMVLDFVRVHIAEDMLGEKRARPYVPLITAIFLGVLAMNLAGIIPGLQIAATSTVGMPLVYAVVAYVAFIVAGIRKRGVGGYFASQLLPAGVPPFLYVLLTPIEFLSTFIVRPFTLTVRLLANMISGHLLLVLCFTGTSYLFLEASSAIKAVGVVTLAMGFAFILFEIFVAALQAYIFALLTAVYIDSSISSH